MSIMPEIPAAKSVPLSSPKASPAEHKAELKQFYAARRKLTGEFPDGKVDMKKLSDENTKNIDLRVTIHCDLVTNVTVAEPSGGIISPAPSTILRV